MLPRLRYVLQETGIGLRRNLLMTVAVFLSVAVSLTLVGIFFLMSQQVDKMTGEWVGRIEVSIFLCDGRTCPAITPQQREDLQASLRDEPVVDRVFFESKREAYENFVDKFENNPDLLETITPDALPASFRLKLDQPERFAVIRDKYQAQPGVEDIVDSRETLSNLLTLANVARFVALSISVLAVFAASVLIVNIIRVAAYARRKQTAIMKLVGASNWYIRLPFLLEGLVAGLIGALVAWGIILLGTWWGMPRLQEQLKFFVGFIGFREALEAGLLLLPFGMGMAAIASLVALWGFLDV